MSYNGPKVKLSRKIGVVMTAKAGKLNGRKPYPPGQHGPSKKRAKLSDYGRQLLEKQRLRLQYNIKEGQMESTYETASKLTGNTADLMIQLLESRLDSVIFRSGFARSMYASRQYVTHGHVFVNGKPVNIPSYKVRVNDVVSIKEKSRKMDAIQEAVRSSSSPAYLEVNKADFSAKYLYVPTREEIPAVCDLALVVEYYSR